jgi:hypothetical protein
MTLALNSLQSAQSQIGIQEIPKGSNAGPDVEKYLKSVGLSKGYAWCMAFVYWNVQQAATKLVVNNPLKKTAGVIDQWNYKATKKVAIPLPGTIFIMDFSHGVGHTGFVEKVEGNLIHTIEGNTNADGSREGYEVARRVRKISQIKGFIQI